MTGPDDLASWIVDLAARIMLADLDHDTALTAVQRQDRVAVERRRILRADLRRLREHVG